MASERIFGRDYEISRDPFAGTMGSYCDGDGGGSGGGDIKRVREEEVVIPVAEPVIPEAIVVGASTKNPHLKRRVEHHKVEYVKELKKVKLECRMLKKQMETVLDRVDHMKKSLRLMEDVEDQVIQLGEGNVVKTEDQYKKAKEGIEKMETHSLYQQRVLDNLEDDLDDLEKVSNQNITQIHQSV